MTAMRVLMVSDVYFPRINGVSTSIESFRASLPEQGVASLLVAPRYGGEAPVPGIVRVPARPVPRDPEDRIARYRPLRAAVLAAAADCDLIHAQTPFAAHYAALHAARRLGKPILTTYHTLFEEYLHHYAPFAPAAWLRALARRFSRGQCNQVDAVVAPSTAMRDRLRAYGVERPIHVLPTGLPESRFQPGDRVRFRAARGIDPDRPVALFVGRVAFEKNIGFLLEAMARVRADLPDALLLITGEGPARADLERQAARLGVTGNVRFLGYLDRRAELPDAYAAADVFAFASRTETQGLVLLEALAQGCPVLALAAMGTTDILAPAGRPAGGCVVAPDDVTGYADALADLLRDRAGQAARSAAARGYAATWSDRAMAARLATVYRQLTGA